MYEDRDLLVINKARGMVVHPAPGNYSGTLVNALLYHCRDLSDVNGVIRPGIVHRIDKDTTGLLVVAKNNAAHLSLAEQLKNHGIRREYIAIAEGVLREDSGTIDLAIGRCPSDRKKMAVRREAGREAVTHFSVLERLKGHTLVACRLETGRTHQIRVHLAYIGHPLVGDPLYGTKETHGMSGQALHARTLSFIHPASGVPVSSAIEDTLSSGGMLNYSSIALSLGEYAAPMGTGAALVLLACGLFLWSQKDAHMTASVSFLATCALIAFFFPRQAGLAESDVLVNALPRLQCVRDELLTGAVLFSAVFLINEPYTCAHHRMGRILYGVLVGVVSMGFRYYGVYETGVCFAVLAVNSISAWIDRTEVRLYRLLHLPASGAGKEAAE